MRRVGLAGHTDSPEADSNGGIHGLICFKKNAIHLRLLKQTGHIRTLDTIAIITNHPNMNTENEIMSSNYTETDRMRYTEHVDVNACKYLASITFE